MLEDFFASDSDDDLPGPSAAAPPTAPTPPLAPTVPTVPAPAPAPAPALVGTRQQLKRPPPSPSKRPPPHKTPKTWENTHRGPPPPKAQVDAPTTPTTLVDPRTESLEKRREVCTEARAYTRAHIVRVAEQVTGKALLVQVQPTPSTSNPSAAHDPNMLSSVSATSASNDTQNPKDPKNPKQILVHLQHDWAFETQVHPGDVVHLVGNVRPDPDVVASWSALLWPSEPRQDGYDDVDDLLNQEEEDLWADMPLSQKLQATPMGADSTVAAAPMSGEVEQQEQPEQGEQSKVEPTESLEEDDFLLTDSQMAQELGNSNPIQPARHPSTPDYQPRHNSSSPPPGESSRATSLPTSSPRPQHYPAQPTQPSPPAQPQPQQEPQQEHQQNQTPQIDVLSLSARPADQGNYLILHPDTLLSVTRVAASASCVRRAVLQERMREPFPQPSKTVVMGIMLHEVLQACLLAHTELDSLASPPSPSSFPQVSGKTDEQHEDESKEAKVKSPWPFLGDFSPSYVAKRVEEQVASQREVLFALGIPPSQAISELHDSVRPFTVFGARYLAPRSSELSTSQDKMMDVWGVEDQSGAPLGAPIDNEATILDARSPTEVLARIRSVLDVEEDVWSPKWGLKGKVDATIMVETEEEPTPINHPLTFRPNSQAKTHQRQRKVSLAPLELKTGRATHVLEHRAQTMLYTLLMSDRYGTPIDAGLLFYSQSGQLHRVRRVNQEVKALVLARNAHATFLNPSSSPEQQEIKPHVDHLDTSVGLEDQSKRETSKDMIKFDDPMEESVDTVEPQFETAPMYTAKEDPYVAVPLPPTTKLPAQPSAQPKIKVEFEDQSSVPTSVAQPELLNSGMSNIAVNHAERMQPRLLPEPIDDAFVCKRCYALDQCSLYRTAHGLPLPDPQERSGLDELQKMVRGKAVALLGSASTVPGGTVADKGKIQELPDGNSDELVVRDKEVVGSVGGTGDTPAAAFFRKWDTILTLEHAPLAPARAALWTQSPAERYKRGTALPNLILDPSSTNWKQPGKGMYRFTATFVPAPVPSDAMNDVAKDARGLMAVNMSVGDPVLLSVPPALISVAQGYILALSTDRVVVGMDHALLPVLRRAKADRQLTSADGVNLTDPIQFVLDKDELTGGTARLRANLGRLLLTPAPEDEAAPGPKKPKAISSLDAASQRASIVSLDPPRFSSLDDPLVQHGMAYLQTLGVTLNTDQVAAIEKVLQTQDYALVQGMPGTGKTTLIAILCRVLAAMGCRVLVTAYTHSALDTVLAKLVTTTPVDTKDVKAPKSDPDAVGDPVRLLRLAAPAKVHPSVRPYTVDALTRLPGDALEERLSLANIVGSTALGAHHPLISAGKAFDFVILDEAAQATMPAALGPILTGRKFILVGDELQLPPLVRSDLARQAGGQVSLFALLKHAHPEAVVPLRWQYRMNKAIMHLANTLTYRGQLRCALPSVGDQRISLPPWSEVTKVLPPALARSAAADAKSWLAQALEPGLQAGLLDTDLVRPEDSKDDKELDKRSREGRGSNAVEARICAQLVAALFWSGAVRTQDVALVTPYRQQVGLLVRALRTVGQAHSSPSSTAKSTKKNSEGKTNEDKWWEHVEVLTADRAQGKDKAVVIVSMVRTWGSGVGQLLKDARRINVALTRAQQKLLVVGSARTLSRDALLAQMVQVLPVLQLPLGADEVPGLL